MMEHVTHVEITLYPMRMKRAKAALSQHAQQDNRLILSGNAKIVMITLESHKIKEHVDQMHVLIDKSFCKMVHVKLVKTTISLQTTEKDAS